MSGLEVSLRPPFSTPGMKWVDTGVKKRGGGGSRGKEEKQKFRQSCESGQSGRGERRLPNKAINTKGEAVQPIERGQRRRSVRPGGRVGRKRTSSLNKQGG